METLIGIYVFIVLLFFLTYSGKRDCLGNISRKQIVFVTISYIILLFFHCAVEINSVADLWSYESRYKETALASINNFNDAFRTKEYVFNFFCKAVSYISHEFRLFLVIDNIILLTLYFYSFKKYSVNLPLAIVCMVLVVYFQSIFVLRQHLAIAVLLLSFPYIINKKIIPYLIICLIAFNIHLSAIAWIPVYFIYNVERKSIFVLFMAACAVVISIIGSYLGDIFMFIEADYSSYLDAETTISLTKKLIYLVYLLLYILILKDDIFKPGINRLTTTLLSLSTIGYLFSPPVGLVDRMLAYYSIALLFAIPLIWSYMSLPMSRFIFAISVIILQGYVSAQPLSAEYYTDYSITTLDIPYYILMIVSIGIIFRMYKTTKLLI